MTGAGPAGPPQSPWWADALADPWRDPSAPAAVVVPAAAYQGPVGPPEPEVPDLVPRRGLGMVLLVSVVSALLAGALGGALGYVFAERDGGPTVIGGTGQATTPQLAQRPPDSLAGVVQKVLPSVVTVRVSTGGGSGVGSGFVASADGYVITNDHVVEGATGNANVMFSDGSTASGKIIGRDPESDIAVLKVNRNGLTPVEFGDSDAIAVGDPVLALGSPLALANTVTYGIVSAVDRPIQAGGPGEQARYYAAIQTDAAVNHGNSGGPLVDGAGRVIGVNSVIKSLAVDEDEAGNIGLAFAVPVNQAKRVAQEIIERGKARRTIIGAQLDNNYRNPNGGVRLRAVEPAGPAAGGGLRPGDVVTRLEGRLVYEPTDLIALVRKYAPGSVVSVEFKRGAATQRASVTLAADAQ
ncbi:MAG TPA: trypsin-like peptidase domain-containing protein [Micromonosporaceae bacterium]|nr:trypsin-like peptidase domain-containing protein [Micromonosporaceae bacterium]